jgi:hypothetical protein
MTWTFESVLWEYIGVGAWHFISVPFDVGTQIKLETMGPRHGFGSVRVLAVIDGEAFKTSVFPDKASGSYLLPVKAAVRKAIGAAKGQSLRVQLTLI